MVESREHDVAVRELGRLAFLHNHVPHRRRHQLRLLPPRGVFVLLARTAGGGSDGMESKVGVLREEEDEPLADGTGTAQDT
jgi:hypothetical protein